LLASNSSGDLYFPADDAGDIGAASFIGTYTVTVPEPSVLAMISMLGIGILGFRRR